MKPHETLLVERRGAAVWITLNRPEQLNAITPTMATELADVVAELQNDRSARVVVLRGAGKSFCAGLDIKAARRRDGHGGLERLGEIVLGLRTCPQPVIALVQGAACGGGFVLALAADIRIAGQTAKMNDAFINLGLSGCELGISYLLPREVGMSVAAELMYTGRFVTAERAERLGLVSFVVADAELEMTAQTFIDDMLRAAPLGLRKTKETLHRAADVGDLAAVIDIEAATQIECMAGPDFAEGLRAFVEKRAPIFAEPTFKE